MLRGQRELFSLRIIVSESKLKQNRNSNILNNSIYGVTKKEIDRDSKNQEDSPHLGQINK